jgi:hypothetical protein
MLCGEYGIRAQDKTLRYFNPYHMFNPLNAELIPMCRLLALLEAHHILHVSR